MADILSIQNATCYRQGIDRLTEWNTEQTIYYVLLLGAERQQQGRS